MGFNHWEMEVQEQQLAPADLWRGDSIDWWATQAFQVRGGPGERHSG